jgi:hypothetical protein
MAEAIQMKKKSHTIAMILLFAMLISIFIPEMTFATSTNSSNSAVNANESQFIVKVNFEEPVRSNVQVQSGSYDSIQLSDCSYMDEIGKPMLPTKGALVLLPPKMDVNNVNVVAEFETLLGQFEVHSAQPPVPADGSKIPSFVEPDLSTYTSAADYPSKLYDQETVLSFRGYQLLYLRLFPVRYVGASKQIKFCRTMEITVSAATTDLMTQRFKFHEMGLRNSVQEIDAWVSEHVLNPEMVTQYEAAVSPASEPSPAPIVDYLVITRQMFLGALTTYPNSTLAGASLFIRNKKFAGLQVAVETLENIRTQYTGYDDAENVRKSIQHYYTSHGLTYVLLLGDVENATATWYMPVRYMYNPDGYSSDGDYTPSDFYYAGLDGNWDNDGDHYFGERAANSTADEADWSPEVYVGRITAKTTDELDTELNKVANFKGFSDSSITNMVLCGGISDSSTDEKLLKEYIRDNFVPASVTVSELYASVGTLTEHDFADVVNVHRPEVINSAGHGSETALNPGFFTASTTPPLMKGPLYLWYADACLAASFDYASGDCCGEAMMKDPDGGGMFVGATRVSWYYMGYPDHLIGLNGKQDWLFWQEFFQYKIYDPGKCLYQSKVTYIAGGPDLQSEDERKNLFAYNLIGDPQARATCAKRGRILFDESHNGILKIEKGQAYYDLATALRSVGYTVDSLQVEYGPSTTINFDDLANGQVVDRHYRGLNFSAGYYYWNSTGSSSYPPHSTPNVAFTHETSNYIILDVAVDYVSAYFCAPGSYGLTWNAYDGAGNLIGSTSIPADSKNVLRSITNPWGKIKKLAVTGSVSGWQNYWTIDDLYYSSNAYLETMWKYDTLVLIPGDTQTEYTVSEVGYTKDFVSNGGGLCMIGENWAWMNAAYFNAIANYYGVTFQENVFYDPTNYEGSQSTVLVHTFPSAGDSTYGILVKGLATVLYPAGSSLVVSSPATSVATGDGDSYTTAFGSASAASQGFEGASLAVAESPVPASYEAVMAAAKSGSGKVFCVGDANLWDSQDWNGNGIINLCEQDNLYLMYNVFDWLTETRATRSVSVLIDQTHSLWSVDCWIGSSISGLCDYLRHGNYGIYILKTSPITYSKLAEYDVFVLPVPMSYFTGNEITAIKQYVSGGGHLWVIGDHNGFGTVPNTITSQFDINFDNNGVTDPTDYQSITMWVLFYGRNFVHQITHGLTKLEIYASSSLTLSGSAASAINTDSDATPASKSVMAVNTYGNGRVVVIGDSDCFTNVDTDSDGICSIDEADNAQLALRILSWVPCLQNYQFPSPTSTVSLANPPYMWVLGDYVQQQITWPYASPAIQLVIHFEISANMLSGDGYIPINVLVNGAKVGELTINRGHNCIDKTFSLIPNPVNQGNFTIRYVVTRTVDPAKGSVTLDYTNSYIKLAKAEMPTPEILYLVVRGNDNTIYYRSMSGNVWGGWNALPGSTCDSPAAAVCNNELHIVVRGIDGNTLWHGYVDLATTTFSGWTLLSGSTPSAPTLTSNGTVLSLVVRGGGNSIWYRLYSFSPRSWGSWNAVTGATIDGLAAAMLGNHLHIAVRGSDGNTLWHIVIQPNVGVVRNWVSLSGSTPSKPTLTANQTANTLYLAVRGASNPIFWRTYDGATDTWAGWNVLPVGTTGDGPAATAMNSKLHTVVRGMDGNTLWWGYVTLATSTFPGWTLLSGSTPSTPTLTS